MNSIIKDYELKLDVILEIIKDNDSRGINSIKLNTIARCYKGFIRDLKQEALNIDSVSCFSLNKVKQAYEDGQYDSEEGKGNKFNINNYS